MAERKISPKQIEAILKLDGPSRYDHFIKHVVDCEQAWGLYDDGWATGGDDDSPTVALWPARECAELCASGGWEGYQPESIPLEELLEDLVPKLMEQGMGVSVFATPGGQSVRPSLEQMVEDLRSEILRYE